MAGGLPGVPLPAAAWPLRRDGLPAPGAGPLDDPLAWLRYNPVEFRAQYDGALVYRSRRAGAPRSDWRDGGVSFLSASQQRAGAGPETTLLLGGSERGDRTWAPVSEEDGRVDRFPQSRHLVVGMVRRRAGVRTLLLGGLGQRGGERRFVLSEGALALEVDLGKVALAGWWRRLEAADGFQLLWQEDAVGIEAPGARSDYGLRVVTPLAGGTAVLRLQGTSPHASPGSASEHVLHTRPRLILGEGAFNSATGHWSAALGLGQGEHRGFFTYQGARYGRVLAQEDRWWLRLAWRPRPDESHWTVWAGYTGTVWDTEGAVEFWPFTDTTVDLLGLRRYVTGDARVESVGGGLRRSWGADGPNARGSSLRAALDLLHVWGKGLMVSWQPGLLGIGRVDIREDPLQAESAQLLALGLQGGITLGGGFRLEGGAAQLVPLAVQDRPRSSPAPPPVPPPPPSEPAPESRVSWAGFRWTVGLTLDLGTPGPGR